MSTNGTNLGTLGRRRKNLAGPGFSRRQKERKERKERKGKDNGEERNGKANAEPDISIGTCEVKRIPMGDGGTQQWISIEASRGKSR